MNSLRQIRPKFSNLLVELPTHLTQKPFSKQSLPIIHVKTSKNNTIVSLTQNGDLKHIQSCGTIGLKKSNRKTSDGGYQTTIELLKKCNPLLLKNGVSVFFKGFGKGRDACWRALRSVPELNIVRVVDVTPVMHGGCRPKKKRRI